MEKWVAMDCFYLETWSDSHPDWEPNCDSRVRGQKVRLSKQIHSLWKLPKLSHNKPLWAKVHNYRPSLQGDTLMFEHQSQLIIVVVMEIGQEMVFFNNETLEVVAEGLSCYLQKIIYIYFTSIRVSLFSDSWIWSRDWKEYKFIVVVFVWVLFSFLMC